jgi:hypothetical protein
MVLAFYNRSDVGALTEGPVEEEPPPVSVVAFPFDRDWERFVATHQEWLADKLFERVD